MVSDVERTRSAMNDTMLDLNEANRKKEIEEFNANSEIDNLSGNVNLEGEVQDRIDIDDTYLREGVIMLADIIASRIG